MANKQFYINKASRYLANNLPIKGQIIRFGQNPMRAVLNYDRDYASGINYDNQGNPTQITNTSLAIGIENVVCRSADLENFPIYESLGTPQGNASTLWIQNDGGVPQPFLLQQIYRGNTDGLTFLSLIPDRFRGNLDLSDTRQLSLPGDISINGTKTSATDITWNITNGNPGYPPIQSYRIETYAPDLSGRSVVNLDYAPIITVNYTAGNITEMIVGGNDSGSGRNFIPETIGDGFIGAISAADSSLPVIGHGSIFDSVPYNGNRIASLLFSTDSLSDQYGDYGRILIARTANGQENGNPAPYPLPTTMEKDDVLVIETYNNGPEVFRVNIGQIYESLLGYQQGFFDHNNPGDSAVRVAIGEFSNRYTEILYRPTQGSNVWIPEEGGIPGLYNWFIKRPTLSPVSNYMGDFAISITPISVIGELPTQTVIVS